MIFNREPENFKTMSQWHAWRLGLDFADIPPGFAQDRNQNHLRTLHQYFVDLLVDLYTNPQAYALPDDPYEAYVDPRERLCVDKEKAERMRGSRLKARVAIEAGIFDFLYQVGQVGEIDGQNLHVDRIY